MGLRLLEHTVVLHVRVRGHVHQHRVAGLLHRVRLQTGTHAVIVSIKNSFNPNNFQVRFLQKWFVMEDNAVLNKANNVKYFFTVLYIV